MKSGEWFKSEQVMHHSSWVGIVCAVVEFLHRACWVFKMFIPVTTSTCICILKCTVLKTDEAAAVRDSVR